MLIQVDRNYLIHLLAREMKLQALEVGGVDNWAGFTEGNNEVLSFWNKQLDAGFSEEQLESGDIEFEDIAREYVFQNFDVIID